MTRFAILALLLAGCTDAPSECGGQSLGALRASITTPYEVIYTDLPRGTRGQTYRMGDGPAIVLIEHDMNRVSRDGALAHELCHHVLRNDIHPAQPQNRNHAAPDRGKFWDRLWLGAPI